MKHNSFLLLFLFLSALNAKSQTWLWTQRVTDSVIDYYSGNNRVAQGAGAVLATDGQENIIMAKSMAFGLRPPTVDSFVVRLAKYDKHGRTIWVRYFKKSGLYNTGSSRNHVYDMKVDNWGNIYLLMRNFTVYHLSALADGGTANCLVKIDAQGRLIWKKPVSAIESSVSAPQYARLALHPQGTHLYAYVNHILTNLQFLDSVFTKTAGQDMMILCRIDTAGRITKSLKVVNAAPTGRFAGFDVNEKDEVLITGTGYKNITLLDTVIVELQYNEIRKNFFSVIRGGNFTRKWTRVSELLSNNALLGTDYIDAKFSKNGDIVFLVEIAKSGSSGGASIPIRFSGQVVTLNVPNQYENPHLFITDSSGNLLTAKPVNVEARTIVRDSRLVIDKLSNYYTCGYSAVSTTSFVPSIFKFNPDGSRAWANSIMGIASGSLTASFGIAAQQDYPVVHSNFPWGQTPVLGQDTLVPNASACPYCSITALSAIGGQANVIRGTVFRDYNNDHHQDAGEDPEWNLQVSANDGEYNSFTDHTGRYVLVTQAGNYTVDVPVTPRYFGSHPDSYAVSFTGFGSAVNGKDFALTRDTIVDDVAIDVTHIGRARPGFNSYLIVTYKNIGTIPANGSYTMKLDPGIIYTGSDSLPVFTGSDSLRWNYTNLRSGERRTNRIRIRTETTVPLGSLKKFPVFISPYDTDTSKIDNADTAFVNITGSYDPNDKQIYPGHDIRIDSVQGGKQTLEYTIRFQNTGTDTAFNIHITDTLSGRLDFSKIKLLANSHPVQMEWQDPDILHFYFRNVLLPDSNRNEPRSHGFVKFQIKPKTTLTTADTIYNSSAIYFDYNVPVITNTVNTQFRNNIITSVQAINRNAYSVSVSPNPAMSDINYSGCCFTAGEIIELSVYDMQGKKVISRSARPILQKINGSIPVYQLASGIYLLRITGKRGTRTIKFIKQY